MYKTCILIYIYIFCNKFQQSSSLRRKPFTVDVMINNGNGQQIQVCKLLILNTKNFACLNWHVARHLTKKLKSHPKNEQISPPKKFGGWQLWLYRKKSSRPNKMRTGNKTKNSSRIKIIEVASSCCGSLYELYRR